MDNLTRIHHLREDGHFSEEEANALTAILLNITRKTKGDVARIKARLQAQRHDPIKVRQYQEEIHRIVRKWGEKVTRLGAVPTGAWKALIPSSGPRPYEWEFPRSHISIS